VPGNVLAPRSRPFVGASVAQAFADWIRKRRITRRPWLCRKNDLDGPALLGRTKDAPRADDCTCTVDGALPRVDVCGVES